jgi:fatty-acyl-CoA synthase
MIPGLMQHTPLNIISIITHAATAHPTREVVSRQIDGPNGALGLWRYDYAAVAKRVAQGAHLLGKLGVGDGSVVSSLAWNTHRHFELMFAVPSIGAVLHTANPRLSLEQLAFTINHAGSTVLFHESNMMEQVATLKPLLPNVEHYVVLTAADYDARIAGELEHFDWPTLDENGGAMLCYTSGTTGDPKGVLYSHRSIVLHAMAGALDDAFGVCADDGVLPCSSLYHAGGWGLPHIGAMVGAKFVLPGDKMDGASLSELIINEDVTFATGVPTVWTLYLNHIAQTGVGTGKLKRVMSGGSAVPRVMFETFRDQHNVTVRQLWGMTETSPLGVAASATPALEALGPDAVNDTLLTRQGRRMFGIELKIIDDEGHTLPEDGVAAGAVMVRGPWVLERYYKADNPAGDKDGWFDTGDIGTIDHLGYMRLTDRSKDVIKSGGEWVSSIDIENIAVACPGVKIAAVAGVFHPKWEERPIIVIEAHEGATVTEADMRAYLDGKIVKWWMPDKFIFAPVPLTATGKIDKKVIRERYKDVLREG